MEGKGHEEIYEEKPDTAGAVKPAKNDGRAEAEVVDAGGVTEETEAVDAAEGGAEAAGDTETEAEAEEAEPADTQEEEAEPDETAEAEAQKPGADGGPEPASDGKWHVFGKKKEKKDPKDQKIEELTDQLKRQMAEFDNFRKRTEKEKSAMFEVGARSIIEKMLPVIDNFERGLATVPEDAKETPFAEGMDMIYKQLLKNLEEAGVKPIEAVGQPFDPNFHNAVMHVEDENLGENVVAQEFQKGYIYRDTVVRHSMVQVAN